MTSMTMSMPKTTHAHKPDLCYFKFYATQCYLIFTSNYLHLLVQDLHRSTAQSALTNGPLNAEPYQVSITAQVN